MKVSHTELMAYLNCRRLYRLRYMQKIYRRTVAVPLITGRAIHAYLEAWYQGLEDSLCERALLKQFELKPQQIGLLTRDDKVKMDIEKHRALAMCSAYTVAYASDKHQYPTIVTETKGEIQLTDDITFNGYVDCLVQDISGDWWVKETKSAASGTINEDYFRRVSIDWQVAGYAALAREKLGVNVKGIIYDVLIKTKHSQKQGETLQAFVTRLSNMYKNDWKAQGLFERREVILSDKMVERWKPQATLVAEEIRAARQRKEKNWPMCTNSCLGKFGACDYLPVCTTGQVDRLLYDRPQ